MIKWEPQFNFENGRWHGRPVAYADSQSKGPKARSSGKTPEDHQFSTTFSVVELWFTRNDEKCITYLFPKFVPYFLLRHDEFDEFKSSKTATTASIKERHFVEYMRNWWVSSIIITVQLWKRALAWSPSSQSWLSKQRPKSKIPRKNSGGPPIQYHFFSGWTVVYNK